MKRTIIIKDADPEQRLRLWKTRVALTFLCAVTSDGLQWLIPFLWPAFDFGMVLALLILWGWRWEVLVAVIPELIPGLELAPTWTLFAAYLFFTTRGQSPRNVTPSLPAQATGEPPLPLDAPR